MADVRLVEAAADARNDDRIEIRRFVRSRLLGFLGRGALGGVLRRDGGERKGGDKREHDGLRGIFVGVT